MRRPRTFEPHAIDAMSCCRRVVGVEADASRTPSTRRPAVNSPLATQALAPAAAAGRNRRRAKMLMVRKKAKSYANAQGIKAVSTKRPLGVRKR